tara:strand:- start:221 stop:1177 length:957 start_codon:yes stop_codon:yes gene_type:complete
LVYKTILAASTLVVMAACGGSTLKINLNPGNLPGLTPLGIGDAVTANSDAEVVALNYNTAAVGATVTAADFAGVSDAIVTIVNSVAGNAAYTVFGVDNSSTIRSTTVGPNLNLLTQAATDVKNAAFGSVQSDVSTIGGQTVAKNSYTETAGTSQIETNLITVGDISGYHKAAKIGDANSTFAVGTVIIGTATRDTAIGDFSYQGMAIVDMANDVSYDSETATMTVNFETLSGEFTANTFTNDDAPAMNISMTNAVTLNNADGTISGSGTITVNGATGNMGLVGIMASDNSAVAGAFITNNPTQVGGAESGIFALPVVD